MIFDLFKNKKNGRALPDRSIAEIAEAKERLNSELRAAMYLYDNEKFIVCSITGITEYGEPIVLDVDTSDENLGKALCDKLLDFSPKCLDGSNYTLSDWKAFKASGAKTARKFENKSVYIYVTTVNAAIIIEAAPRTSNEKNLKARCSTTGKHVQVGADIRKAIKASKALRDAGML